MDALLEALAELIGELLVEGGINGWFYAANRSDSRWVRLLFRSLFWFGLFGALPLTGAILLRERTAVWSGILLAIACIGFLAGLLRAVMVFVPTIRRHKPNAADWAVIHDAPLAAGTNMTAPAPCTISLHPRIKVLTVLFACIAVFLLWSGIALAGPDGRFLEPPMRWFLLIAIHVVNAGLLWFCGSLLLRWVTGRGAMTLTPDGICDTFFIFTLLAFWTTVRVRRIAWEAIEFPAGEDTVRVRRALLPRQMPPLVRFLLTYSGLPYQVGNVTREQLADYRAAVMRSRGSWEAGLQVDA